MPLSLAAPLINKQRPAFTFGQSNSRILDHTIFDNHGSVPQVPDEVAENKEMLREGAAKALIDMHDHLIKALKPYLDKESNTDWVGSRPALELIAQFKDPDAVLALIKTMAGLLLYAYKAQNIPTGLEAKIKEWWEDGQPALNDYKIKVTELNKALTNLRDSSLTRARLQANLKNFRDTTIIVFRDKVLHDGKLDNNLANLLKMLLTAYNKESTNSLQNIARKITYLKEPLLTTTYGQFFEAHIDEDARSSGDGSANKAYMAFVKKHKGTNTEYFSKIEREKLYKDENLKLLNQKLALAQANEYKAALARIIRPSGETTMDVKEILKQLKASGISTWRIPKGFVGQLNEAGEMYTSDGKKLSRAVYGGTAEMNPAYKKDPKAYYFKGQGIYDQKAVTVRTLEIDKTRQGNRSTKVTTLIDNLEKKREKWTKIILQKTTQPNLIEKAIDVAIEIFYQKQPRPGSKVGSTQVKLPTGKIVDRPTYALLTLLGKHVKVTNDKIICSYEGKKAAEQKFILTKGDPVANAVFEFISMLKRQCEPNEHLWDLGPKRGQLHGDIYRAVNERLATIFGEGITAHKFRHAKGTLYLKDLIEKKPPTKAESASTTLFTKYLEDKLKKVGESLGHMKTNKEGKAEAVGMTAGKNYILPEYMKELYESRNLRKPVWLEKVLKEKIE